MPATPSADSLFKMGEYRLADMDRCGIDIEVLSLASYSQWVKGSEAVTLSQNANNYLASLVREHPSRFDQTLTKECTKLPEEFSAYYKRNVWVTPSGIYDYDNMDFCIRKLGIGHLLFSADYPYIPQDEARAFLMNAPLTEADKEKFAYVNAAKLLHL